MSAAKRKVSADDKKKCRLEPTPTFRVSYPHLFKPQQLKPTDKPKYSVVGLFSKKSDMSWLKRVINQAKVNAFGPDKDEWPEFESPVIDGDDKKYKDNDGYKGNWAIKFSANAELGTPGVVDERNRVIEAKDAAKFYPGCYAHAIAFAYVWEYMGRHGVGFILDHVQKVRDGDAFGGRKPIGQAFQPLVADEGDEGESEDVGDFT